VGVRVVVPASSANIGPGYDAFGLALGIHNEFEGELAGAWGVEVSGEGAGSLSADADNHVLRAMAHLFERTGRPDLRAEVVCHNGIPVGRGLGSSSSAIVGGLVLADALAGSQLDRRAIFEMAAALEGHADNVAAALYGGFVITSDGPACTHIDPAGGIAAIVVLGERELSTHQARSVLPGFVPHGDAAANAAHAALLAVGIATGAPGCVSAGMSDAIHERYRALLVPDMVTVRELFEAIGAGPAVLSGAGPSMLALVQAETDERALERARHLAEVARTALGEVGRGQVMAVPVGRHGARIV